MLLIIADDLRPNLNSYLPTPSFRSTSKYHPTIVKDWEVTFTFAQQKKINFTIKTIDSSPEIHTPNLDELAATSAVFNRAYVQVVQKPMCLCASTQVQVHLKYRQTYSVVNESHWFFKLTKHAGWDSFKFWIGSKESENMSLQKIFRLNYIHITRYVSTKSPIVHSMLSVDQVGTPSWQAEDRTQHGVTQSINSGDFQFLRQIKCLNVIVWIIFQTHSFMCLATQG